MGKKNLHRAGYKCGGGFRWGSNRDAHDPDDDNDGYSDTEEIAYGSDPRDVNSLANTAPQITLAQSFPDQLDSNGVFHIGHTENKTHILNVSAIDADGDDLNYSIYGWLDLQHFEINATTGDLSFKNSPDYESPNDHDKDGVYGIVLRVSDNKAHHDQPVYIWLVNENESPYNLTTRHGLTIAENQPMGTIVGEFDASDPDKNSTLSYSLIEGNGSNDNRVLLFIRTVFCEAHKFLIMNQTTQAFQFGFEYLTSKMDPLKNLRIHSR